MIHVATHVSWTLLIGVSESAHPPGTLWPMNSSFGKEMMNI
jgi:hypothetical protein